MSLDFAARPAPIVSVFDGMLDARSLEVRSETLDRTDDQHRTCKAWPVPRSSRPSDVVQPSRMSARARSRRASIGFSVPASS